MAGVVCAAGWLSAPCPSPSLPNNCRFVLFLSFRSIDACLHARIPPGRQDGEGGGGAGAVGIRGGHIQVMLEWRKTRLTCPCLEMGAASPSPGSRKKIADKEICPRKTCSMAYGWENRGRFVWRNIGLQLS
jgi:hypothetical protein